jgi:poly-gamma-glutamate capsule biosynthesis protein CapA/YwtB (metallophosphatase superfamily)
MKEDLKIVSAGDLAPLRSITECEEGVREVWRTFKEADVGMVNLEIALTNSMESVDKAITLKANPDIAYSLADGGIDFVSFANNHAGDFGKEGLLDTMEALKKAEVSMAGAGLNLAESIEPVIKESKGVKIAFFGFCSALPTGFAAAEHRSGVAPLRAKSRLYIDSVTLDEQPGMSPWVETSLVEEDIDLVCQKISEVKEKVDLVIAHLHWGIPHGWCALFQGPLADYQRPMAHRLIDAGVDLIIGHHPHVLHGIEKFGKGAIAYSLGNFLFHSMADDHETELKNKYPPYNLESLEEGEARESVIMEVAVRDGSLKELVFRPIAMNRRGEPEFMRGSDARRVLERLKKHSSYLGCDITIEESAGLLKL